MNGKKIAYESTNNYNIGVSIVRGETCYKRLKNENCLNFFLKPMIEMAGNKESVSEKLTFNVTATHTAKFPLIIIIKQPKQKLGPDKKIKCKRGRKRR